ncbi:DNA-directed RNA polymerase subunit K [Candidatus Woesearchaeota archaeon]|nr:DNA-directed RNA polymerase subunit K [Candidatus Woesearchaeota archaeon]
MAKKKGKNIEEPKQFTKYEKARILGSRALQISMGAPYLVKIDAKKLEEIRYNPLEIAKIEFDAGVIPITVIRPLPEVERAESAQ